MLFLGFFFAFAIKAPLWPFHTWLPDAAAESKAGTSVLLIGVLDKVGTFGMLRYCLPLFPGASTELRTTVIVLAGLVLYPLVRGVGQSFTNLNEGNKQVAHGIDAVLLPTK